MPAHGWVCGGGTGTGWVCVDAVPANGWVCGGGTGWVCGDAAGSLLAQGLLQTTTAFLLLPLCAEPMWWHALVLRRMVCFHPPTAGSNMLMLLPPAIHGQSVWVGVGAAKPANGWGQGVAAGGGGADELDPDVSAAGGVDAGGGGVGGVDRLTCQWLVVK